MRALLVGLILLASAARAELVISGQVSRSLEQLFDMSTGQIVVLDMKCKALPAVSKTGRVKIACDSATNTLKASVNGGAFAALGGAAAGGANAVQVNSGGLLADGGCTMSSGNITCSTFTSTDQNNAAANKIAITGNAAGTTPAVDCGTLGATKKLTLANTNKTDTDTQRVWQYCNGTTPGAYAYPSPVGRDYFDDFIGGAYTAGTSDKPGGDLQIIFFATTGTCTPTTISAPDNNTTGILNLTTSATTNGLCNWYNASNQKAWRNLAADTTWFMQARVNVSCDGSGRTNCNWSLGLSDNATADATGAGNMLVVSYLSATDGTHYRCETCNGGTCTSTTQAAAISAIGTYDTVTLSIVGGALQCCINGACVTNSAHMPATTTAMSPFTGIKALTTTGQAFAMDYWWFHPPAVVR